MLTPSQLELIERCSRDAASAGVLVEFIEGLLAGQQQAEAARHDSETRFRQFVELSSDGISLVDEQGRIILWNSALERITGIAAADALGRFIWDVQYELVPDEVRTPAFRMQAQLMTQQILEQTNLSNLHVGHDIRLQNVADGSVRAVHTTKFTIPSARGVIIGSITRDISERQQLEQALRDTAERLALTINGAELGTWDWDIQTGAAICNDRWAEMLSYDPANFAADYEAWKRMIHPDDWPGVHNRLNAHLSGQTPYYQAEYRLRTADGGWKWILDTGKVVERDADGRPLRALGVHLDITDRKNLEAALRESEARYRIISELSSDFAYMFEVEPGGLFKNLWVTDAFERITGFTQAESLGRGGWQRLIHPDDLPAVEQAVFPLLERPMQQELECRFVVKSGAVRHIWTLLRSIADSPQEYPTRIYGICKDITERKQVEAMAGEQTRLEVALHREQELNQLQKLMMLRIAHEFRTPLTVIQTSSEILSRYMDRLTVEKRADHFRQIRRQIVQLTNMLNDAAYVMKADDLSSYQPAPCDCRHLIEVAAENFASCWLEHTLEVVVGDNLDNVSADGNLILQIINNLLSNAAKYSDRGSTVHLYVEAEPQTLVIRVRDEGTGIVPEDQQRIYDLFYRGSNAGNVSGLGLGLHLVRRAVETHRGHITFETVPNAGTTFTVRLPLTLLPAAAATERSAAPPVPGG
ncbi:MAG: PAS domain S-box protein [Chloroflexi bacterium]|nr:PAS domain S-box protein [Chloroflexota bacterium]